MCEVVAGPAFCILRQEPGHNRVTDSRHQAALGGHGRTPGSGNLSSGGYLRSRRDTRGNGIKTVRDREAPGLNSSSPWLYIQSEARQGVAAQLGPVESVHLKKIRGRRW
jgi:hypothetical protein